ncbi:hypothetical protein AGOR_G00231540 [Albula goreensis]|uniref:Uncharacterized protein n=1 Tax=Albula goreensis TaxID=1534307 RepID=A0A8T3CHQ5_9TELE|nr:hypothetical protein AGOR_G00231540 [Albula goreensis]
MHFHRLNDHLNSREPKPLDKGLGWSYIQSLPKRSEYTFTLSKPVPQPTSGLQGRQVYSWRERSHKPPTPWEAASRSPFGLVDEAFAFQNVQQSVAASVKSAAHRKSLPEPPAEWKARVSYEPPPRVSETRLYPPLGFSSPAKSTVSAPAGPTPYGAHFRQQRPWRSATESSVRHVESSVNRRYVTQPSYKPVYNTGWRW